MPRTTQANVYGNIREYTIQSHSQGLDSSVSPKSRSHGPYGENLAAAGKDVSILGWENEARE
jgi:hypothetical protein